MKIQDITKRTSNPKKRQELSPEAREALAHLRVVNKPMKDFVEWRASNRFEMRKSEPTPEGLNITVVEFEVTEVLG